MRKRNKGYGLNQPLAHPDHRRPMTRREFISQGFALGTGSVIGGASLGLFGMSNAYGLSSDLPELSAICQSISSGGQRVPFICFDLAGGANFAGSNVLVGQQGGQLDLLDTSGYQKQGLPADRVPVTSTNAFVDSQLGLLFHSESQLLAGIMEKVSAETAAKINGAVIAARSENDTGNNPHNPMYAINKAGANGGLLSLIGSRSSDSGGNSMAPMAYMDPTVRPTKVDRESDVTGLVDTGDLAALFGTSDAGVANLTRVMETMYRLSDRKLSLNNGFMNTGVTDLNGLNDAQVKDLLRCAYLKSADTAEQFSIPIDPSIDPIIRSIFTDLQYTSDREFRKTASVMKMVVNGHAGAGTITMGGYDYHTGDRSTGEARDLRAGRCIGACLEYASRLNKAIMIYVFSDGSVFSNGMIDDSQAGAAGGDGLINQPGGQGKGVWTGDNQQTASSFFLVFDPRSDTRPLAIRNQIGYMRPSGDVETSSSPMANNVNLLVESVALNYMALHGRLGEFEGIFDGHGLGSDLDQYIAFDRLASVGDDGFLLE